MVFEYPNSSLFENVVYVASLKWFVFVFVCVIVIVIVIARLYLMLCVPTLQHIWYITSLEGVKQIFAISYEEKRWWSFILCASYDWQYYVNNFPNCIYSWKGIFNIQSSILKTAKEMKITKTRNHKISACPLFYFKGIQQNIIGRQSLKSFYFLATFPSLHSFHLTSSRQCLYWQQGKQNGFCHFMDIGNI